MIVNKRTGYLIEFPKEADKLKDFTHIDVEEWMFYVPTKIDNDHEKVIYKVGFLFHFYKNLSVKLTNAEIFKLINDKWQVFKSPRQMERLIKKFVEKGEK